MNSETHILTRTRVCFSLCLFLVAITNAQTTQSGLVSAIPGGTAANYFFAKQGDITIIVNVWGDVSRPGRYEVSSTMDLINLLSLAGGPGPDATLGEVKITRLVQDNSPLQRKVFTIDLEDLTRLTEEDLVLYPGDTIILERSFWSKARDVTATVLPFLSFTAVILQLIYILDR